MSKLLIEQDTLVSIADQVRDINNTTGKFSLSDMESILRRTTSLKEAIFTQKIGLLNIKTQEITTAGTTITKAALGIKLSFPAISSNAEGLPRDPYYVLAGAMLQTDATLPTSYNYNGQSRYVSEKTPVLATTIAVSATTTGPITFTTSGTLDGGGKRFVATRTGIDAATMRLNFPSVPYRTSAVYVNGVNTDEQPVCPAIFYYVFVIGPTSVTIGSVTTSA